MINITIIAVIITSMVIKFMINTITSMIMITDINIIITIIIIHDMLMSLFLFTPNITSYVLLL